MGIQVNGRDVIRLTDVDKVFLADDMETRALTHVSVSIREGEYVSIGGPSGCGKSTLLSIMGLLDEPTSGTVEFHAESTSTLGQAGRAALRNRAIGFVFQDFNLIGDLTVFQNVELPLFYRGVPALERRERVSVALERVGMSHRSKHFPGQLSGGQQQRVAVARAVVGEPSILLADEPTGNLDSTNGEAVMKVLDRLHEGGVTICMVTHDPRYSLRASRVIEMFDGRIVTDPSA
jgi:putative ABC transport system ATP-binding protein